MLSPRKTAVSKWLRSTGSETVDGMEASRKSIAVVTPSASFWTVVLVWRV